MCAPVWRSMRRAGARLRGRAARHPLGGRGRFRGASSWCAGERGHLRQQEGEAPVLAPSIAPESALPSSPPDSCPTLDQRLVHVCRGATWCHVADLGVAVSGDDERHVLPLALGKRSENPERLEGFDRVVERARVGDRFGSSSPELSDSRHVSRRPRADSRYASWIATARSQPKIERRSGWLRSRIVHAVWQASSISSCGARTTRATARWSSWW